MDGERALRAASEEEGRAWLARYREDHHEDDPDATHVQIVELRSFSWLRGGKLVPRERLL